MSWLTPSLKILNVLGVILGILSLNTYMGDLKVLAFIPPPLAIMVLVKPGISPRIALALTWLPCLSWKTIEVVF